MAGFTNIACTEEKQFLSGKWILAEKIDITRYDQDGQALPPPREDIGFNFYSADSCEANVNFYNPASFDDDYFAESWGRKTVYKLEDDSLKIFDRQMDQWKTYQVMFQDINNLILNDGNMQIKVYVRKLKN